MAPPQQGTFKLVPAPGVLLADLSSRKGVSVAPFADRLIVKECMATT